MSADFYTVGELWSEVIRVADASNLSDQDTAFLKDVSVSAVEIHTSGTFTFNGKDYAIPPIWFSGGEVTKTWYKVGDFLSSITTFLNKPENSTLTNSPTAIPKGVGMPDIIFPDLPAVVLKGDKNDTTAILATATLQGVAASPIAATISGPEGLPIVATVNAPDLSSISATLKGSTADPIIAKIEGGATPVSATIEGGAKPVLATVGGGAPFDVKAAVGGPGGTPIEAVVTANVGGTAAPIQVSLSALQVGAFSVKPDLKLRFSLFGIPIWSVRMNGSADVG